MLFENDVNMYGIQTINLRKNAQKMFENDVNMYGIQTFQLFTTQSASLRMM